MSILVEEKPGNNNNVASFRPSRANQESKRDTLVIPASDAQGHSVKMVFRCPPDYSRRVEEFAEHPNSPHKTRSDVLRYCLHYGLSDLQKIVPELDANLAELKVVNKVAQMVQERIRFVDSLEEAARALTELQNRGFVKEAQQAFEELLEAAAEMGESRWKGWYREELVKRFPHLNETST